MGASFAITCYGDDKEGFGQEEYGLIEGDWGF